MTLFQGLFRWGRSLGIWDLGIWDLGIWDLGIWDLGIWDLGIWGRSFDVWVYNIKD